MGALITLFLIALYVLPSIIAGLNKKKSTAGIIVLNLLTGWTFVGWVIALVWACCSD